MPVHSHVREYKNQIGQETKDLQPSREGPGGSGELGQAVEGSVEGTMSEWGAASPPAPHCLWKQLYQICLLPVLCILVSALALLLPLVHKDHTALVGHDGHSRKAPLRGGDPWTKGFSRMLL